jgi:hypothetical protein
MVPYPGPPRRRLRARPLWLEAAGQQRLQAMHARLQIRRQLLSRWASLVDQVDQQVTQRLEGLGGDVEGYDTSSTGPRTGLWDEDAEKAREELDDDEDTAPPARRASRPPSPRATPAKKSTRKATKKPGTS